MPREKKVKNSFWRDGLSIEETKFSVLVVSFLVSFFSFVYLALVTKDIQNLKSVVMALITAITGVNIAHDFIEHIKPRVEEPEEIEKQDKDSNQFYG